MTARIPAGAPPRAARITILDILRALALLGIVIVHAHDHFNLYLPMPPAEGWQAAANSAADWAYEHLFVSKSFLLFSFLFGLSFFIQLDRQEQKGVDFRKRFMWRLALLFLLGLAHTLFYDGDILTIFGVLGFALVALYKRGTPLLVILCLLCLMQPVAFMDTLSRAGLADLWPHSSGWFHPASPAAGPSREFLYAHGSWGEAALWNLTQGQAGKWQFFLLSGRIWQTLGLFILGMLAGRWQVFVDAPNKRRLFLRMLGISGALFLALLAPAPHLPAGLRAGSGRWTPSAPMGKPRLYRGLRLRRRPAVHPSRPAPAIQAAQQRRKMHADVLRLPNAGIHVPVLRVGAGTGAGHGTVGLPVRRRCRLPASSLGVPPLANALPVRPPGMALAHRHHVPHAAVPQAHAIGRAPLLPPCVC